MPISTVLLTKSAVVKAKTVKSLTTKTNHTPQTNPYHGHPHPNPYQGHPHPNPLSHPNPFTKPGTYPTIHQPYTVPHTIPVKFSCKWNVHGSNGHGSGTITCKW